MFEVSEHVSYAGHGVCQIIDIEEKQIDKRKVQYYVLEPIAQRGTRYYVPMHNAVALSKMRNLLSKEELRALLLDRSLDDSLWIADENRRKLSYRDMINRGSPSELAAMIRLLQRHRAQQQEAGRMFHVCDAGFLKDAQNLLRAEIAFVLGEDAAVENAILV